MGNMEQIPMKRVFSFSDQAQNTLQHFCDGEPIELTFRRQPAAQVVGRLTHKKCILAVSVFLALLTIFSIFCKQIQRSSSHEENHASHRTKSVFSHSTSTELFSGQEYKF